MVALLSLLFCFYGNAEVTSPGLELVLTQPVETDFSHIDLRSSQEVWLELIDAAKKRIDFSELYIHGKDGEPLDKILEHLDQAARRGVKIRMLVDQSMLRASNPATLDRLRKIKNLQLRLMDFGKVSEGGILHAKYFVVDKSLAFLGSQNFDWRSLKHVHETGVKIFDAALARQLQDIFDYDWAAWDLLTEKKKVLPQPYRVSKKTLAKKNLLLASPEGYLPPGVPSSERELPRLLAEAKEEICVQLLEYSPLNRDKTFYPVIDNALRSAQARGVKIKLVVSHWNTAKPAVDHLKSLSLLPGVEVRILKIPEAKEGFIPFARVNHSKFMVIDKGIAWIGTSNWSGGYLDKSRNVELVVRDVAMAKRLKGVHDQLWNAAGAIELDAEYSLPRKE